MSERARSRISALLIVLTGLVVVAASVAGWLRTTALDTERWTETVAPLPAEEPVADALAGFVVDEALGPEQLRALSGLLPEEIGALPLAGSAPVRALTERLAAEVIASPAFRRAWTLANRTAHRAALAALDGDASPALADDGAVVIDLSPAISSLREDIEALGVTLPESPAGDGRFEVLTVDERSAAARLVRILRDAALVLPVVALALAATAILIHPRRMRALALTGVAMAVAGLLTLAGLRVGQAEAADATTAVDPLVVATVGDVVTRGLVEQSLVLVLAGAGVALGAATILIAGAGAPTIIRRGPGAVLPWAGPAAVLAGLLVWPAPRLVPALGAAALAAAWWIGARLLVAGRRESAP